MFCQFCDIHATESDAEAPSTKGSIHELEDGEDVIGCLKFFTLGDVVVVTYRNLVVLGLAVLQLYSSCDEKEIHGPQIFLHGVLAFHYSH